MASDETSSLERLSSGDGVTFNNHSSFPLNDSIDLPAQDTEDDQEIDIEGLDHHDSYLWLVGSHSIKRKKVEKEGTTEKQIKRLAKTEIKGNRFILARIPLVETHEGANQQLVRSTADPNNPSRELKAGQLEGDVKSNSLVNAILQTDDGRGDPHFANFLTIPGKDNGFDIEGLAVGGDRIFMGLRGPVLRGWAGILEVSVNEAGPSRLNLRDNGPDGRQYKKHFLDLKGLGVRDLCVDGNDLLILAGPTMNLDGPVAVFRWRNALDTSDEQLIFSDELEHVITVPNGVGVDHAEGMTLLTDPERLLIVYDSPGAERKISDKAVKADVFAL
nr:B436 [uncultured bacterium]